MGCCHSRRDGGDDASGRLLSDDAEAQRGSSPASRPAAASIAPASATRPPAASPAASPEAASREPAAAPPRRPLPVLMRRTADPRRLLAAVDAAGKAYLDVDRSLLGVARDDPEDAESRALVARLRMVSVASSVDATRELAALLARAPKPQPTLALPTLPVESLVLTALAGPRGS